MRALLVLFVLGTLLCGKIAGASPERSVSRSVAPLSPSGVRAVPTAAEAPPDSAVPPLSYARRHWTVEEGLPVNSIRDLTQGPQGYLWMATTDGLVRFDGVDFSVYRTDQYDGLPSNRLSRVVAGPDSTLWMLTGSARLIRFRINAGTFAADTLPEPLASRKVTQLNCGPDSTLWISTEQGALAWRNRAVRTVLGADDSLHVWRTIEARDGTVWLATKRGL